MKITNSIYKSMAGQEEIMVLYNQVLSQWPVPAEHIILPTQYGDTFVIASGDLTAPPMILLHGSGSNSATWANDVIGYSPHFRVYAVDIPGEPGKSDPTRFGWDGPAFVDWLDDVLNGLDLEKVILVGMSLGGWATMKYALYKPERVAQAVLIVPSGVHPPRLSFAMRAMVFFMLGEWGREQLKRFIFKNTPLSPEVDRFLTLVGRHFKYRLGAPPLFSDEELQRLTMPLLLLAGEQDVMLNTQKTAERLQKLVPDLTVKLFKEDGHATINTASWIVSWLNDRVKV